MRQAIALATDNVASGGGPFGALVVRNGEVLATGVNQVTATNDPTAHAEVVAIRAACKTLGTFQLTGCVVYTSCEPCPMCLAALYWSRCEAVYYGNSARDAAAVGFDDSFLYEQVALPIESRKLSMYRLIPKKQSPALKPGATSRIKSSTDMPNKSKASPHRKSSAASSPAPVRIAILGFGTVGSSVARLLAELKLPGIELTHIFNRNIERKRSSNAAKYVPASVIWTENFDDILRSRADVVVELMGGLKPAEEWLRKCFAAGKSVVTANKQLIAYRGTSLFRLAAGKKVQLVHGAAVAGGVPVIPGMLQGLSGDRITRISGIVNGTCNYILSRMESGASYAAVLADAQALGYAEANPSADVDGFDARAKLCILSRIAMRAELDPDSVSTQTISTVEAVDFAYAKELNCTIRQISRAQLDTKSKLVHARVAPMLVPLSSPIAWSHGTQNMVVTSGRFGATSCSPAMEPGANLQPWPWSRTSSQWPSAPPRWNFPSAATRSPASSLRPITSASSSTTAPG